jgi:hypothetical protein
MGHFGAEEDSVGKIKVLHLQHMPAKHSLVTGKEAAKGGRGK